jgi:hypothetical protein
MTGLHAECDHRVIPDESGDWLVCEGCGHVPPRPRGRPPLDDKRKPRGGFNDAEWAKVKASAAADGMTASAWIRMRAGL